MDLKNLFNLDPSKYSIANSAGAFRRVRENSKPLSLSDLIGDLVAPTVPENIPKVNPIDSEGINSFMSTFAPAMGLHDSLRSSLMSGFGVNSARADQLLVNPEGTWDQYKYHQFGTPGYQLAQFFKSTVKPQYNPYVSTYNSNISAYNTTYKPQIDTYNKEVTARNAVVDPFKQDLTEYNTEVQRRAGEANIGLVNPDRVTKETSQATGDRLAESDLYSENLHSMMIDRISAQPVIDEMSSLFSKGTK